MASNVKGTWTTATYPEGNFVLHDGIWHVAISIASSNDMPFNPLTSDSFNKLNAYGEGVGVLAANKQIAVATSKMKGEFNPHQD